MGRAALYYDDYVTAIHYFTSVVEARPYMADAYYYRAYAKFSLEDYVSAELDLDQAVTLNPFRTDYLQLRGLCRIHNAKYQEAIEDYTHYLKDYPDDQGAMYNRVLCRLELKDTELANTELDGILQQWPKLTRAYLVKAQTCLELKDTLQGAMWIDSLLTFSRREPGAWAFKGRFALRNEEYELADSCYTQALKYDIGNADYHLERAQVRNAMSRYSLALADYDRVIEMIPQHFVAHYNRGLLRARVGDDNRAIEDFDFVISEEPDNVLAIYNRAELRRGVGDYRGAISDYSTLIAEYPNFIYGYAQRSACYRAIGQNARAQKDEARVQRSQLDLFFGNRKGKKELKKVRKRSDRELEHYDQLVEEDADTTRTFMGEFSGKVQNRKVERVFLPMFHVEGNNLVVEGGRPALFCTDDRLRQCVSQTDSLAAAAPETSLQLLRTLVQEYPTESVILYNLGCAEAMAGSLEEAERAFRAAIESDPLMAEAYYNRAVVFLLLSENDKAVPLLSKAGEMGLYKAYNLLKQSKKK